MAVGFRTFRVRESTAVSEADRAAALMWMDPCGCRDTNHYRSLQRPARAARARPTATRAGRCRAAWASPGRASRGRRARERPPRPSHPRPDRTRGARARPAGVGADAAARLAERPAWLHLDLDVLDERALPAVSYPQPLGPDWELVALVRPSSPSQTPSESPSPTSIRTATPMAPRRPGRRAARIALRPPGSLIGPRSQTTRRST